MSESSLKYSLRVLSEQAVQQIEAGDRPLEYFAGATAVYSIERDQVITALPAFEDARAALGALPVARERYGAAPHREPISERLILQFVYGFFKNLPGLTFDPDIFETSWEAYWQELLEPEWTWLGLANLRNFRSESMLLDLGDGITIRGRSFEELARMGWSEWHREQLSREWHEGAVNSAHVILVERKLPKSPDNLVLNDSSVYDKAARAVLVLRLLKDGGIGIGRMWFLRPASFELGLGGYTAAGYPASFGMGFGGEYTLDETELPSVRDLYRSLVEYESVRDRAPVNLDLALRSFADIYERHGFRSDTHLVDAITAAEALLGTEVEIIFKLAFRVAQILGNDDDERVTIFEQMKGYYDTRSRVVHGSTLREKHGRQLNDQQALRDMVRRLLVGFLRLTISSGHSFDKTFFRENLDSALLHGTRRSELRVAMGLEERDP